MSKCENCLNLKHRYMLLTGMHYPAIQGALTGRRIKALQFSCEGMGCKYWAQGTEISSDDRDIDWNCPHFVPLKGNEKKYPKIDSHANRNKYPKTLNSEQFLAKVQERKQEA